MIPIPDFLLERTYVKGSLRNVALGCEFELHNQIGAATLCAVRAVEIDSVAHPPDQIVLRTPGGQPRRASTISASAPLELPERAVLTVLVVDAVLAAGEHSIWLAFETGEIGGLEVTVTDAIAENRVEGTESAEANRNPDISPSVGDATLRRPIKVAIIGAGSAAFARRLMADFLCTPGLECGTFALVDIDAERLELAHRIGERLIECSGRAWAVEATTRRSLILADCDYVISTIEVAGPRNVRSDYDIPLKYGVDQCIGDTIGPGGIFKMLRTGPSWLEILRDVERLSPRAIVMNYTNPMSALTLLALRATRLSVVGLCHSVQGTSRDLATYLDIPYEELRWRCAGINHLAWFTELTHHGEDMYPKLREAARRPEVYECDPVRFEVMLHLGAFVTESSGHFSEYVPHFRKRPDLLTRYVRPGYRGESGFYANNWPRWRTEADEAVRSQLCGTSEITLARSSEYATVIVDALESNSTTVIHGNVLNTGLIDNLPTGDCVEVPVLVDASGLHPTYFGPLPPQLAALDAAHMYVHELMVEAVLERSREAALHALMLDPLSAAVCSLEEIRDMFNELWEAERADLAEYGE